MRALAVLILLALASPAVAGTYRGGALGWQVHDLDAPHTVEISLTTVWNEPTSDSTELVIDFGDGSTSGPLTSTVIFTGTTSAKGEAFTVRRVAAMHTYAANGTYVAFVAGCCRHATANAASTDGFRLESRVVLGSGSYGSPVMFVVDPQLMSDASSTIGSGLGIPSATWWGGELSGGHVSSLAESGIGTLPPISWRTSIYGGHIDWSGPAETAGASYSLSMVGEDIGGATTMLDLIIETVPYLQFDPYCLVWAGQKLGGTIGMTASATITTSGWNGDVLTLIEPTATATLNNKELIWTPDASDAGRYGLALLHIRNGNYASSCSVALHVPLTSTPCEDGLAMCGDHTVCTNTTVGFSCNCEAGYLASSSTLFTCAAGCVPPTGPLCGFNNGYPVGWICCTDPTAPNGVSCTCPIGPSMPPDPPPDDEEDEATTPEPNSCRVGSASSLWFGTIALLLARRRRRRRRDVARREATDD